MECDIKIWNARKNSYFDKIYVSKLLLGPRAGAEVSGTLGKPPVFHFPFPSGDLQKYILCISMHKATMQFCLKM
jgi:hypothetical protein